MGDEESEATSLDEFFKFTCKGQRRDRQYLEGEAEDCLLCFKMWKYMPVCTLMGVI